MTLRFRFENLWLQGDHLNIFFRHVENGDGHEVAKGEDDTDVLLDALDGAYDAFEGASENAYLLPGTAGEGEVAEHRARAIARGLHDVAQGGVSLLVCLQLAEGIEGGAHEDVVLQGRHVGIALGIHEVARHVGLHHRGLLAEQGLQLALTLLAAVEDAHRIPMGFASFKFHVSSFLNTNCYSLFLNTDCTD